MKSHFSRIPSQLLSKSQPPALGCDFVFRFYRLIHSVQLTHAMHPWSDGPIQKPALPEAAPHQKPTPAGSAFSPPDCTVFPCVAQSSPAEKLFAGNEKSSVRGTARKSPSEDPDGLFSSFSDAVLPFRRGSSLIVPAAAPHCCEPQAVQEAPGSGMWPAFLPAARSYILRQCVLFPRRPDAPWSAWAWSSVPS